MDKENNVFHLFDTDDHREEFKNSLQGDLTKEEMIEKILAYAEDTKPAKLATVLKKEDIQRLGIKVEPVKWEKLD